MVLWESLKFAPNVTTFLLSASDVIDDPMIKHNPHSAAPIIFLFFIRIPPLKFSCFHFIISICFCYFFMFLYFVILLYFFMLSYVSAFVCSSYSLISYLFYFVFLVFYFFFLRSLHLIVISGFILSNFGLKFLYLFLK